MLSTYVQSSWSIGLAAQLPACATSASGKLYKTVVCCMLSKHISKKSIQLSKRICIHLHGNTTILLHKQLITCKLEDDDGGTITVVASASIYS